MWRVGNNVGVAAFYVVLTLAVAGAVIGIFNADAAKFLDTNVTSRFVSLIPTLVLLLGFYVYEVAAENHDRVLALDDSATRLGAELQEIHTAVPNIGEPTIVKLPFGDVDVVQLLYRNVATPPHSRTAENVSIRIELTDENGKAGTGWNAVWLVEKDETDEGLATDPNDMGPLYPNTMKKNITPGWIASRLPIVSRRQGQTDCFMWSSWKYFLERGRFQLGPGTHYCRVRLLGTNFSGDYDFPDRERPR